MKVLLVHYRILKCTYTTRPIKKNFGLTLFSISRTNFFQIVLLNFNLPNTSFRGVQIIQNLDLKSLFLCSSVFEQLPIIQPNVCLLVWHFLEVLQSVFCHLMRLVYNCRPRAYRVIFSAPFTFFCISKHYRWVILIHYFTSSTMNER